VYRYAEIMSHSIIDAHIGNYSHTSKRFEYLNIYSDNDAAAAADAADNE